MQACRTLRGTCMAGHRPRTPAVLQHAGIRCVHCSARQVLDQALCCSAASTQQHPVQGLAGGQGHLGLAQGSPCQPEGPGRRQRPQEGPSQGQPARARPEGLPLRPLPACAPFVPAHALLLLLLLLLGAAASRSVMRGMRSMAAGLLRAEPAPWPCPLRQLRCSA